MVSCDELYSCFIEDNIESLKDILTPETEQRLLGADLLCGTSTQLVTCCELFKLTCPNVIHCAVWYSAHECLSYLLENDYASLCHSPSAEGYTPLHLAAAVGDFISLNMLIQHGAVVNRIDMNGRTPLHFAIKADIRCVVRLCSKDVTCANQPDRFNKTPFDLAMEFDDLCAAEFFAALLQVGRYNQAIVGESNQSENTPIEICTPSSHTTLGRKAKESYLWIPFNLEAQLCVKPEEGDVAGICQCNLPLDQHPPVTRNPVLHRRLLGSKTKFVQIPTDTFGELEYPANNYNSQFVRICAEQDFSKLFHLFESVWELSRPQLVLSFYGDYIESSATRESLKKLIWKTSETTLTWVVTDGLHQGISPIVSEAVKQYNEAYGSGVVEAVGVVPWRRVCYMPGLTSTNYMGSYPAPYAPANPESYNYESLDCNMTHHIFVDSDQRPFHNVLSKFRVSFEARLRGWLPKERESDTGLSYHTGVQTCGILSGGGFDTLTTIHSAITDGMPFVLLRNSGGLADILCECIEATELGERNQRKKAVTEGSSNIEPFQLSLGNINRSIGTYWYDVEAPEIAALLIQNLLSNMHMMCVCDIEEDELDYHVLLLLLGSTKAGPPFDTQATFAKLEIAIALNRSDVAREKVFLDGMKWDNERFASYMTSFLLRENVAFIRLFMEKGFDIKSYVTCAVLEKLYTLSLHNAKSKNAFLNVIRRFMDIPERVNLVLVGKVLTLLMGNHYYPLYLSSAFCGSSKPDEYLKDCPSSHLFIWALLTERREVAELFWMHVQEPLAAALLAASLLRKYANYADSIVNREELMEISNAFEVKATGLLSECFVDDPVMSSEALVRDRPIFGHMSCLMLAAEGHSMSFITHRCSEQYLEKVWCGSIERRTSKFSFVISLLVGLVMPLLVPFAVRFDKATEEKIVEKPEAIERILMKKGNRSMALSPMDTSRYHRHKSKNFQNVSSEGYERQSRGSRLKDYGANLVAFYMAPSVRFAYATMAHLAFLCFFTYILLFYVPRQATYDITLNIVLFFWVITVLVENIRQMWISGLSVRVYFKKVWKTLEFLAILLYVLGICLHFMLIAETNVRFEMAPINPINAVQGALLRLVDIFYGFSLFLFFYRLLEAFTANMTIGPLVIMIQTMIIEDLIPFLSLFMVSLFSFAILQWVIAFKNTASISNYENMRTLFEALQFAYLQIFGEYNVERITTEERASCSQNNLNCLDEAAPWISPILLGVFVITTQVLLLNLLIAMFASTYVKIQAASTGHWALQRYNVICEFVERSPIPPPLIVIWHIYLWIKYCAKSRNRMETQSWHPFRKTYENQPGRKRQLIHWERLRFWDYLRFVVHGRKRRKNYKTTNVHTTTVVTSQPTQNNVQLNTALQSFQQRTTDNMQELLSKVRHIDELDRKLDHITRTLRTIQDNMIHSQGEESGVGISPLKTTVKRATWKIKKPQSIQHQFSRSESAISEKLGNMIVHSDEQHMIALFSPPTADNTPSLYASPVPWKDKKASDDTLGWKPTKFMIHGWTESDVYEEALHQRTYDPMGKTSAEKSIIYETDPVTGAPRNPLGSTGVPGKGHLPVWGPNPAVIIVLTREQTQLQPTQIEYAVYKHQLGCQLPWFLVHHPKSCDGNSCVRSLVFLLVNNRAQELQQSEPRQRDFYERAKRICNTAQFKVISSGYLNDMVNTDNAWIEPFIVNIHLTSGQPVTDAVLKLFSTVDCQLEWININAQVTMRDGHRRALRKYTQAKT